MEKYNPKVYYARANPTLLEVDPMFAWCVSWLDTWNGRPCQVRCQVLGLGLAASQRGGVRAHARPWYGG